MDPKQAAKELELDFSVVQKIYALAGDYAPGYDVQKICDAYQNHRK